MSRLWQNGLSSAVALAVAVSLCGCSLGSYGTLVARYTYTASAVVIDVYTGGIDVRPIGPDAGVTAGYRRASYIFARQPDADGGPAPRTTWHWLSAPWPDGEPIVRGATVFGVDAQITPELRRFTGGYLDQLLTIGPRADESRIVEIYYDRDDPLRTYVSVTQEKPHARSSTSR